MALGIGNPGTPEFSYNDDEELGCVFVVHFSYRLK